MSNNDFNEQIYNLINLRNELKETKKEVSRIKQDIKALNEKNLQEINKMSGGLEFKPINDIPKPTDKEIANLMENASKTSGTSTTSTSNIFTNRIKNQKKNNPIKEYNKNQQIRKEGPVFRITYSPMKRANIIAQVLRCIKAIYEPSPYIQPKIDKETVNNINNILKEKNGWYPIENIGFYLPSREELTYDKNKIEDERIDKIEFIFHNKIYFMYNILESFIDEIKNYYRKDKKPHYPSNIENIIKKFLNYSNIKREEEEKLDKNAKQIVVKQALGLPEVPTHTP